jgi:DNA-binding MarR family transcriptional regulator
MQQDASPLQPGLGFLIAATRRRLKQVLWAKLAPFDLTPQQFWVLSVLQEKGPQSLHGLAQEVGMDDPTASRVVKLLCDRGILRSETDPAHGRRVLIRPATEGNRLLKALEPVIVELREQFRAGLSLEEQEAVRRALNRMVQNLEVLVEQAPRTRRLPNRRLRLGNL